MTVKTTSSRQRSSKRMSDTQADGVVETPEVEEIPAPDPSSLGLELPDDREGAEALLLREIAASRTKAETYLNDLKRIAADFDNFRKRSKRDHETALGFATEKVVVGLFPVLDTFDAALGTQPETDGERLLYSGLINTREQLLKALESEGLEVVPTVGEEFDPEVHEPVGAPGGDGTLVVSDELRRGYRINGKLLRAALVVLEAS